VPFGMVQLSPDTRDNGWDGCSGYHYSDTRILGFSHNHLSGTGCGDLGNILLMPTVGPLKLVPGAKPGEGYQSRFFPCGRNRASRFLLRPPSRLQREGRIDGHGARRSASLHLSRLGGSARRGGPAARHRQWPDRGATGPLRTIHAASGYRRSKGWGGDKVYYFVGGILRPFHSAGVAQADKDVAGKQTTGRETKGHFDFKTKAGEANSCPRRSFQRQRGRRAQQSERGRYPIGTSPPWPAAARKTVGESPECDRG